MATTEQETVVPGLYVVATVSLVPTSVQPVPVIAYVTAPVPEPPEVVSTRPIFPLA